MEEIAKEPQEKPKAIELKSSPRKSIPPVLWVIAGILVGIILFWFFYNSMAYVSTDDAFIQGHSVPIDPKVSAHVLKVLVDDNQKMNQGDMLVLLNSEDFEVAKQKAEADLESAQANEQEAKRDLIRYQLLVLRGEISKQQFDQTQLKAQTAHAQTLAAQAALKQAVLNVSYTKITAPIDGYVTRTKELFDRQEMQALFHLGYNQALRGYDWKKVPPGLNEQD